MENDYIILEKSQKLLETPENEDIDVLKASLDAFDKLGELIQRTKNQDILEKGCRAYFQFLFESDVFPEDYKQKLREEGQELALLLPGVADAIKSIH